MRFGQRWVFCSFYDALVKAHICLKGMQSGIVALGFDNGSINLGNIFDLLCACLGAGQFSGQGFKRTLNAQAVVYFFQ